MPQTIPLRQAVNDWLQHRANEGRDPRTIESYGYAARLLEEYLASQGIGNPTIADVDRTSIRAFVGWLRERRVVRRLAPRPIERTLSAATVNNYLRSIRNLYNWLAVEGYIGAEANPFAGRTGLVPRVPRKPRLIPTVDEVERLTDQVVHEARGAIGQRNRAVWLVMLDTGIRVSEVARLNVAEYDQRSGRLMVRESKGGNSRDVWLGGEARNALDRYLRNPRRSLLAARYPDQRQASLRDAVEMSNLLVERHVASYRPAIAPDDQEPALFLGREGFRLTAGAIRLWMEDLCKRAGVPAYSPHTIRHFYGTRQATTMPLDLLRRAMGHASVTTTQIYLGENAAALQEAMQTFSPVDAMHRATRRPARR